MNRRRGWIVLPTHTGVRNRNVLKRLSQATAKAQHTEYRSMTPLFPTRGNGSPNKCCCHAAPRVKPNEIRSWLLRNWRFSPPTERPTRSDLERFLAEFDLSDVERVRLVEELERDARV